MVFASGRRQGVAGADLSGIPPQWFDTREATDVIHHRKSYTKRRRKHGFRARMKTANGRKTINAKRRVGRSVNVREKI